MASQASSSQSSKEDTRFVGPIIHFLRHAEAEHKPQNLPLSPDHKSLLEIEDPELTIEGRTQCEAFIDTFQSYAPFITHIISSPLSRTLDTALLALKDVPVQVDILAMPELQTLGDGPNGTGLDVAELFTKYKEERAIEGEDKMEGLEYVPERDVDLRFMQEDWNDEQAKADGRWSADESRWRRDYVRGFVRGLWVADVAGTGVEIVAVGHGSFFKKLIRQSRRVAWGPLKLRSFSFDGNGALTELSDEEIGDIRAGYTTPTN